MHGNTLRMQVAIHAPMACPQGYTPITHRLERATSDTTKSVRTILNRKLVHTVEKKWNAEVIPSQNKSAPDQTCTTAELAHTAAKAS